MAQKKTIPVVLALVLTASVAAAEPPLPPGHPAGVGKAELNDKQTIFVGVGALALGIGVYLAAGNYKTDGGTPPPVTPPTTTATTTTS